ncbi:hypothetical protein D4R52_00930 [bacterium]|nr:MAG: hypothetical protein D4R52_00930 [bacterium]
MLLYAILCLYRRIHITEAIKFPLLVILIAALSVAIIWLSGLFLIKFLGWDVWIGAICAGLVFTTYAVVEIFITHWRNGLRSALGPF